jgi:ABC-type lipoprotein export system ATPase subunit
LDTANGKQVMEIMTRLNQETGVTFVFATHDPRDPMHGANTLRDGQVVKPRRQPAGICKKRAAVHSSR